MLVVRSLSIILLVAVIVLVATAMVAQARSSPQTDPYYRQDPHITCAPDDIVWFTEFYYDESTGGQKTNLARVLIAYDASAFVAPGHRSLNAMTRAEASVEYSKLLQVVEADRDYEAISLWWEIVNALSCIETAVEVKVANNGGTDGYITEGDPITFTFTAPGYDKDLDIGYWLYFSGDQYGIQWPPPDGRDVEVTVPGNGSKDVTLATVNDNEDKGGSMLQLEVQGTGDLVDDTGTWTGIYVYTNDYEQTLMGIKDDDSAAYEASISASASPVSEGTSVDFTVSLSPPPSDDVDVSVHVYDFGGYLVETACQSGCYKTVPVSTSGSATLSLPTQNDKRDESNDLVVASIVESEDYSVNALSAKVTVEDDDELMVSIKRKAGSPDTVTEGGVAEFTLSAVSLEAGDLPLDVSISISSVGGYAIPRQETVTIPAAGTMTYSLTTTDDVVQGPDGSVTVRLNDGASYTPSSFRSATVNVQNDDFPRVIPSISIAAVSPQINEGDAASYQIRADQDFNGIVYATVRVTAEGDYGVAETDYTVRLGGSHNGALNVVTVKDNVREPAGMITATVVPGPSDIGRGYTVGTPSAATVDVNNVGGVMPPRFVSISTDAGDVIEGQSAPMTLRVTPYTLEDLTVNLRITQPGRPDRQVTKVIDSTGEAHLTVSALTDGVMQPAGSMIVTVLDGQDYDKGSEFMVSLLILDVDFAEESSNITIIYEPDSPAPTASARELEQYNTRYENYVARRDAIEGMFIDCRVTGCEVVNGVR